MHLVLFYIVAPPQQGELPTISKALSKTAKYKCNIDHILQHLALASHLEVQSSRRRKRECKISIESQIIKKT